MLAELPDVVDYFGRALIDGRPVGYMIFDALLPSARLDGINAANVAKPARISTSRGRRSIRSYWRSAPSSSAAISSATAPSLHQPEQLERWQASVNMLLREGLFAQPESSQTRSPATLLRYVDGVSPQNWVNARVNELRLSKPTAVAVSCTD